MTLAGVGDIALWVVARGDPSGKMENFHALLEEFLPNEMFAIRGMADMLAWPYFGVIANGR